MSNLKNQDASAYPFILEDAPKVQWVASGVSKYEYILAQVVAGALAGRTSNIGRVAGRATAWAKDMVTITDAIMMELDKKGTQNE